jgi:hypothetical protein
MRALLALWSLAIDSNGLFIRALMKHPNIFIKSGMRLLNLSCKLAKGTKQSRKLPFSSSESEVRKRIRGQGSSTVRAHVLSATCEMT